VVYCFKVGHKDLSVTLSKCCIADMLPEVTSPNHEEWHPSVTEGHRLFFCYTYHEKSTFHPLPIPVPGSRTLAQAARPPSALWKLTFTFLPSFAPSSTTRTSVFPYQVAGAPTSTTFSTRILDIVFKYSLVFFPSVPTSSDTRLEVEAENVNLRCI